MNGSFSFEIPGMLRVWIVQVNEGAIVEVGWNIGIVAKEGLGKE